MASTAGKGPSSSDLKELVRKLAREGPVKYERTSKRIRLLFNGAFVADTNDAQYVWEHDYYPQYYLPMNAFCQSSGYDIKTIFGEAIKDDKTGKTLGGELKLAVRRENTDEEHRTITDMVLFAADLEGPSTMLKDHVKVLFSAIDQWFEEDTPIYVHPKDPYKRVDLLQSSKPIRITIPIGSEDVVLAESASSVHLYETLLPARYYIPYISIKTIYLRPSATTSECPYKGTAKYDHVVIAGEQHDDLIWHYRAPTIECAAITGLRCFYNERVDVWFFEKSQWLKQQRPKTHFA
ncbi:hypothetical protein LTR05_000818 [Lithohypha guttulata]|uniref:DUF427 domain-containing protein n=1 Tax=Lithohypha guttulata TaxID=1690604 RepID=A0AAN7T543_9EURO|nr:hypothetical protein LTR05_000818 [Lithohypha guttulata]